MESKVVHEAIELLNKRVKKLFIATHNHEVEEALRALLHKESWKLERNYPCFQESHTEFGRILFQDGSQVWHNPALQSS